MKLKKLGLMAAAAFGALAISANAADVNELFPNYQLSLDVSGIYQKGFPTFGSQFDDNWRHGNFGADAGLDFWVCKYLGVGVDSWGTGKGTILHDIDGNLMLRMPVADSGFAPYIMGGAGSYFGPDNMIYDAGAGVQFKFNRHIGVFADWRYLFTDKAENSSLARVGLTYGF
jgi:hypothetical protein